MPTKKKEEKKITAASAKKGEASYHYANGKRKCAIATVRLYEKGSGNITVNDKHFKDYFTFGTYLDTVVSPLKLVDKLKQFDVSVRVKGGGQRGQADAICHGIAKALVTFDPALRAILKPAGFLTRDARVKERKKFGLHRARRAQQFSKR